MEFCYLIKSIKSMLNRASIFANHNNNKKIPMKTLCLSSNVVQTDKTFENNYKTKNFDTKAEQWRTRTRNIWQNSVHISVNFSESQLNPSILLSDMKREKDFLSELNWPARKTPKKTTYCTFV